MAKKSFKDNIQGADKLFSANDKTETAQNSRNTSEDNVQSDVQTTKKSNRKQNTLTNTKINILTNVLTNIKDEPKGKNYTFYLTNEVATAIINTAKENNISNSKLVDSILKKVLLEH